MSSAVPVRAVLRISGLIMIMCAASRQQRTGEKKQLQPFPSQKVKERLIHKRSDRPACGAVTDLYRSRHRSGRLRPNFGAASRL
jgi:hypothetical protein